MAGVAEAQHGHGPRAPVETPRHGHGPTRRELNPYFLGYDLKLLGRYAPRVIYHHIFRAVL